MPGKSALVFGASGVSGWSFVNEILNDYPKKGTWDKVHALTNRPLSLKDSHWPDDSRLNIVSGIDLLKGTQEELEVALKAACPGIEKVTHVYYLAYKFNWDAKQETEEAISMWKRSTMALDHLSPALEFVVLQTGAKMYGCHLLENHPTDYIHPPLQESMPRLRPPYEDTCFYYPQMDWVAEYSKDKKWNWCDTRPDVIVGFVPNQNFYSLGTVLGIYFSLYAEVEGKGAECPFPGTSKSWVNKSNDSSADMIAHQTIHLSLTLPPTRTGEGFNVADSRTPSSWSSKWPQLAGYFGLKGVGPENGSGPEVRQYINEHIDAWHKMEDKYGLKKGIAASDLTVKGFEVSMIPATVFL